MRYCDSSDYNRSYALGLSYGHNSSCPRALVDVFQLRNSYTSRTYETSDTFVYDVLNDAPTVVVVY